MLRRLLASLVVLLAPGLAGGDCTVPGSMSLELAGGDLLVTHHDVTYNCCMDIGYALTIDGARLILDESENPPGGLCDCLCCYQLATRIADVPPGTWTVVLRGVGFEYTDAIVVPAGTGSGPLLDGYGQSRCGETEIGGIALPDASWGALKVRYR